MDQMVVNIEEDEWIVSVEQALENTPMEETRKRPSIYKVPVYVKELNKKAYVPRAVSFGPYHHGEPNLQQLEAHKSKALLQFLRRCKKSPRDLVHALMLVVKDLQESYHSLDEPWVEELNNLILEACGKWLLGKGKPDKPKPEELKEEFLHILDAYRKCLLQKPKPAAASGKTEDTAGKAARTQRTKNIPSTVEIIPSAIELYEAGIKFESTRQCVLDEITFEKGLLKLPMMVIDDTTESELLNLIALERLHVGEGHQQGTGGEVAAYVFFMDNIINSEKDVILLHESKIIQNAMGSNEAVARLFNSISEDLTIEPNSSLGKVQKHINKYCKRKSHTWRAYLMHTYFTNPWACLSFTAAIFLFALTILQTIYTIYPLYKE